MTGLVQFCFGTTLLLTGIFHSGVFGLALLTMFCSVGMFVLGHLFQFEVWPLGLQAESGQREFVGQTAFRSAREKRFLAQL